MMRMYGAADPHEIHQKSEMRGVPTRRGAVGLSPRTTQGVEDDGGLTFAPIGEKLYLQFWFPVVCECFLLLNLWALFRP